MLWLLVFTAIASLVTFSNPAHAAKPTPLLLVLDNGISRWNGQRIQWITKTRTYAYPVISPDGRNAAYKDEYSEVGLDAPTPADIYVIDLSTYQVIPIVAQPAGFVFPDSTPDGLFRSDPTWSPDGRSLAWTEFLGTTDSNEKRPVKLVIYDMITKRRYTVTTLPINRLFGSSTQSVAWGPGGIAVWNTLEDNTAEIDVFSPGGKLLSSSKIVVVDDLFWVKDGNKDLIAILGATKETDPFNWFRLDPLQNDSISPMEGQPELIHNKPNQTNVYLDPVSDNFNVWTVKLPGGHTYRVSPFENPQYYANFYLSISPDDSQVAYIDSQNDVYILSANGATKIASNAGSIAWTATAWQVMHN